MFKKILQFLSMKPNVQKLEASRNIAALTKALDYEDDWLVQIKAAHALGRLGVSEPLLAKLTNPAIQIECASALGEIGDKRAFETIVAFLQDSSLHVESKKTLIKALAGIGEAKGIDVIVNLLNDQVSMIDGTLSTVSVDALVKIGAEHIEELVQAYQTAQNHWGRGFARDALLRLKKKAIGSLIKIIENAKDYEYDFLNNVSYLLADIGDERAIQPLEHLKQGITDNKFLLEGVTKALQNLKAAVDTKLSASEEKLLEKILQDRRKSMSADNELLKGMLRTSIVRLSDKSPQDQLEALKSLAMKGYLKQIIVLDARSGELQYELTSKGENLISELLDSN